MAVANRIDVAASECSPKTEKICSLPRIESRVALSMGGGKVSSSGSAARASAHDKRDIVVVAAAAALRGQPRRTDRKRLRNEVKSSQVKSSQVVGGGCEMKTLPEKRDRSL